MCIKIFLIKKSGNRLDLCFEQRSGIASLLFLLFICLSDIKSVWNFLWEWHVRICFRNHFSHFFFSEKEIKPSSRWGSDCDCPYFFARYLIRFSPALLKYIYLQYEINVPFVIWDRVTTKVNQKSPHNRQQANILKGDNAYDENVI